MTIQRYGRLAGVALVGALALTACGSDSNASTGSSSGSSSGPPASAAASTGASASADCAKGSITASGSSAQANAMAEWVKAYQGKCQGSTVNYQSVGSGAGVQQFLDGTTAFAGSDSALKPEEQPKAAARCKTGNGIDLPMVVGPIAVAYNLDGVENLVLDAPTIAKIFAGKITKWNDPAIAKLNSGAKLPSTSIQAFHRSDSSGTTDNFTKYLKAAAGADWTFGSAKEWKAPGGQGSKGSEGVSAGVKQTTGGVGYMELSFAQNSSLGIAKIATGASAPVELTTDTAGKALEAAKVAGTGSDLALKLDYATKAEGVYPIVLVTYEIVCEKGTAAAQLPLVKSFLTYTASDEGQLLLAKNGYGPLPSSLVDKVRSTISALS